MGDLDPSNMHFRGPIRVNKPNGISIGSAVFTWLMTVTDRPTDRQTDHATRSVTIGRIYVVRRCSLKIQCVRIIGAVFLELSVFFWRPAIYVTSLCYCFITGE